MSPADGDHGGSSPRGRDGWPVDGLAAMADIGQFGLEAAAAVVERILDLSRAGGSLRIPLLPATESPERTRQIRRLRADVERLIEGYAEWTRTLVDGAIDLAVRDGASNGSRPDSLELGPARPGDEAAGEAWMHFLDGPGAGLAAFTATDLTCHNGSVVPSALVVFDPPALDSAAARTSHAVRVRVRVPLDARPGPHLGHILASGLPEVSLALRLDVAPKENS
jgi:hypothetical protein